MADAEIHYDPSKMLGYQAHTNFIVAMRGIGKSYGMKKRCVKLFIEKGLQFVYVRRYKEELKDSMTTYFDDLIVNGEFEGHEFEVKGDKFYIDGKIAGHGLSLSVQAKKKSMSFPLVGIIVFDEFMIDPDSPFDSYLSWSEPDLLENLIETVARDRDVPVYLLGNAFTWQNPYFKYYEVKKPYGKNNIRCKGGVLIEVADGGLFKEHKAKTKRGQFLQGKKVGKHIIDNEFISDNDSFICKPPQVMRYFFTLKSMGEFYGVYLVPDKGIYFVTDNYEPNFTRLIYTPLLDDQEPNMILLKASSSPPWKSFIKAFKLGCVWYVNASVKAIVYESIKGGL